jgi:hypothetical protein
MYLKFKNQFLENNSLPSHNYTKVLAKEKCPKPSKKNSYYLNHIEATNEDITTNVRQKSQPS